MSNQSRPTFFSELTTQSWVLTHDFPPLFWLVVGAGLVGKQPTWSEFQILFDFSKGRDMFQMLNPGRIKDRLHTNHFVFTVCMFKPSVTYTCHPNY